ncbi:phosphoribosyltransferase [Methylacidimicrobium tartarophylax]|uniref:Phosphoribosyl transferase n=1 Tax=Methylacidimicrobium tartarophylax TaxID=1041768 RepID=A0A5E6MG44_9BACT|nr:phosphoribosyltransferase [Methylacidimicrobium tartarophylax]VVM04513.1 Putative phosphoribosyl transferase [Methylacidimicrobium tartarophylax]
MKDERFQNRKEAGRLLAEELLEYGGRKDVILLALPRGGVAVGAEIAKILHLPLDVFTVRKLGVPGQEELAMGAIATGGGRVINRSVVASLGIDERTIEAVAAREERELRRREALFRKGMPALSLRGKIAIFVDDGIATGATMRAAVETARKLEPAAILAAVPVAPPSVAEEMAELVDEWIVLLTPESFFGVGQWYKEFPQLGDEEVCALLHEAAAARKKERENRRKEWPGDGAAADQ